MKNLRQYVRRLLETTIKPEPVHPNITQLLDVGDIEMERQANDLQSAISGDPRDYSQLVYKHLKPFMQNPAFLKHLEEVMDAWVYQNKDEVLWAIENENTIEELGGYFDADDFIDLLLKTKKTLGPEWASQIEHTFGQEDALHVHAKLKIALGELFQNAAIPWWKDWRDYFGLPLNMDE